jgi:drug/metabolite transporter (DMT)-like permease
MNSSRLLLLAAAFLFSTGGAVIKGTEFNNWQVAALRSGIAAVALFALLPATRRNWSWSGAGVAAAYALTMVLFVTANKLTTAANAIFLQSTAPLYLLLAGPLLLTEPVRGRDWVSLALLACGMSLMLAGNEAAVGTAPSPARGNIIALISGVAWAGTLGGIRWLERMPVGSYPTLVMGNLAAFALCAPMAFPIDRAAPADWAAVTFLGLIQIGLAYVCLTRGLRGTPALEASLILLAEPAMNPVWAYLAHGEQPSMMAMGGAALILSGTASQMVKIR